MGLFSSLANTGKLQYQSDLEEFERARTIRGQRATMEAMQPAIADVLASMTPEKAAVLSAQIAQGNNFESFTPGLAALNLSLGSRNRNLNDEYKTDRDTEAAESLQQFKASTPIPAGESAKERLFEEYKKSTDAEKKVYDRFTRATKMVDAGLHFQDARDPNNKISKNIVGTEVAKGQAGITSDRLNNFYSDVDNTEDLLSFGANMREDIQKLYNQTDQGSVGYGGLFTSGIPLLPAAEWVNLRDSVISNVGLNKLMELKASSSTGASGMGGLNKSELTMLQNHLGNLKNTSSPEEIKRILIRMDKDLSRIERKRKRSLISGRKFYNKNKGMLGEDVDAPDFIPKEQEYLFTPGGFSKQSVDTPLEEAVDYSKMRPEELLKLMEEETNKR